METAGLLRVLWLTIVGSLRFKVAVAILADDARGDLARLDRDRLINHAPLLGVVAHLDMARHREVLAEGMTDKAVVGKDASKVRVPGKHDSEQIERFALVPSRARPHARDRIDDGKIVLGREGPKPQAPVVPDRKQMHHDGKPRDR